jgi:glycosyltransferase involved in cell wall biosynthesis
MKIVNISYVSFPEETDPELWIRKSWFFKGIWETVAEMDEVIFIDFIGYEGKIKRGNMEYWFCQKSKEALRLPFGINKAIAAQKPDAVVVHGMRSPLQVLFLRLAVGRKTKIVVQDHGGGYFTSRLKISLQKLADKVVDAYFFTSAKQAENLLQQGIIGNEHKVREVMEISSVFVPADREQARKVTGVHVQHAFIWVGHLNANKDPMVAVKAFTEFVKDGKDAGLYMIFQSETLLPEIKDWLDQHKQAAKHITLVGKVPHEQLQYWYNSCDFIISTSHFEAGGVSVCEAMSCGCIPVLSNIPSFMAMTQNQCGIIFEAGESRSLLLALYKGFIGNKESERDKVLQRFESHLSFAAIAELIHEELEGLKLEIGN